MHLGADHEHPFVHAGAHELVGDAEAEHEAGALGADVERAAVVPHPELALEPAARAGEGDVRGHGGEDDEVDRVRRQRRPLQRLGGRLHRQGGGADRIDRDGPAHAGAFHLGGEVVSQS